MMNLLRILDAAWEPTWAHLHSGPGEHFAFLLARCHRAGEARLLIAEDTELIRDEEVTFTGEEWVVCTSALLRAINRAHATGRCLIEVHNHGGENPRFSRFDRVGLAEVVPYMLDSLQERSYAALVTGDHEVYGEIFDRSGRHRVDRITVTGRSLKSLHTEQRPYTVEVVDFDRQLRWLTPKGQRDLGRLRFVIGGAGGTGSHAAMGLAYLGARHFVLIDGDLADPTSLHRLATAHAKDSGQSKVSLAAAAIRAIAPSAEVLVIQAPIQDPRALVEAKMADVLVGCFDNDGARVIWNELAVGYRIPLLDFGVGIRVNEAEQPQEAGGRIAWVLPGGPCLRCMRQIDRHEAQQMLRRESERKVQKALGYIDGLRVPEVAVYALNAAVVNMGLTELTLWLAGVRAPVTFLEYDVLGRVRAAPAQWVSPVNYAADPHCVVCAYAGAGDDLCLESRYGEHPHAA